MKDRTLDIDHGVAGRHRLDVPVADDKMAANRSSKSNAIDYPCLLRERDVLARTALSRSTLRRFIAAGRFPKPVRLRGCRVVVWDARLVSAWIGAELAAAAVERE